MVTGSFSLWGVSDEENNRIFKEIYDKVFKLKDVTIFQRISKHKLAKLQAESEVMLYPTDFNEMFCISALECFAVSTPIISSRKAAMIERVKDGENGFLIDLPYKSPAYKKSLLIKLVIFSRTKVLKISFLKML